MSIPSSEERSKYASEPSSLRMKPQPIFLFSRVTEPRTLHLRFQPRNFSRASTFCPDLRLSLCLRFSPSAVGALPRPPCQASLPESDSSRADQRKENESPLRATQTFGRTLVLHRRHESCLSPGFYRHARSLPSCVPLPLVSKIGARFLSFVRGNSPLARAQPTGRTTRSQGAFPARATTRGATQRRIHLLLLLPKPHFPRPALSRFDCRKQAAH